LLGLGYRSTAAAVQLSESIQVWGIGARSQALGYTIKIVPEE
jgi:hypothetical protein